MQLCVTPCWNVKHGKKSANLQLLMILFAAGLYGGGTAGVYTEFYTHGVALYKRQNANTELVVFLLQSIAAYLQPPILYLCACESDARNIK